MGSDADLVRITAEQLSQKEVTEFVTDSSSGAISIFIGKQISKFLLLKGKEEGGACTKLFKSQLLAIASVSCSHDMTFIS